MLTLEFKKHMGATSADDMVPQIITDCGNVDYVSLKSYAILWDLDFQVKCNIYFHLK